MRQKLISFMKSRKGGIPTIITIVATTIVAVGLFAYTVMNQSTSVKEAGDKAMLEQNKINLMLENSDYVTGKIVLNYFNKLGSANVTVYESDGATAIEKDLISDQSLFAYLPSFNEDGMVESAVFTKVKVGH